MPVLEEIWELVRTQEGKRVQEDWLESLDSRSLAYWFMDDGSTHWSQYKSNWVSSATLHTEGFSKDENELLAQFLEKRGFPVRVSPTRKYFYLYFPREVARDFLEEISPFAHASMRYKVENPWPV